MIDVATVLQLISFAIGEEPKVQDSLKKIFTKPDPTADDWQAEIDSVKADTYAKLVPNSQLPPDQGSTPPAA